MASTAKLNIEKTTVCQLFRAVVKLSVHGDPRPRPQMKSMKHLSPMDKISTATKRTSWRKDQSFMCRIYSETELR